MFSRLGCDAFWTDQNSIKFPSANDTILFARKSKFQVEVHPPTMNFGRTGCWLSQTFPNFQILRGQKIFLEQFFSKLSVQHLSESCFHCAVASHFIVCYSKAAHWKAQKECYNFCFGTFYVALHSTRTRSSMRISRYFFAISHFQCSITRK